MATQAEVVDLVKAQGVPVSEVAQKLGITTSGVYGHLRRAGYGRTQRGRPRRQATPSAVIATNPPPSPSNYGPEVGTNSLGAIEDIRMRIADTMESLESEIAIRRSEVDVLHRALSHLTPSGL